MFMWTEKVSEIDPRMWLLQVHTVAKIKFMSKNSIVDSKIALKQKFEFRRAKIQQTEHLIQIEFYRQKINFVPVCTVRAKWHWNSSITEAVCKTHFYGRSSVFSSW